MISDCELLGGCVFTTVVHGTASKLMVFITGKVKPCSKYAFVARIIAIDYSQESLFNLLGVQMVGEGFQSAIR